ncbi:hypothetical protein K469DRAFT_725452 [Zopfia rhizophila CBS 207.26]|uniref:DUF6594 domain-containing protein n=1 Tax=Zopfia rhizophila CBS 207.26 TaxID=1314779 RepID=A0A6A6EAC1_9PEZI|nr:hypothetical protein K469DRAFT_725452 [Zopfia rhizophila CBS 207.26]
MGGYPELASLMGSHMEVAIFRRFSTLNIQNLLHMQAELMHIEQELCEIAREDDESGDPIRQSYRNNWSALEQSACSGGDPIQWIKLLEARAKLEKYNNTLLKQVQLNSLLPPTEQNINLLREWLQRPKYGNKFLRGFEARTWDLERADLISLYKEEIEQDPLTRWLFRIIPGPFHRKWGYRWKKPTKSKSSGGDLFEYKDSTLVQLAKSLSTILSTLLPTISIFVLYYFKNMPVRLGLIVLFTSLFSLALNLTSKARKVEIFAATSTFAAIQIVFVSNANGA